MVPPGLHTPIRQDAVLLTKGRHNPAAGQLLDYLKGDKARGIMRTFGYEP
jgi:molybdate transport system substrate-binding protein